MFDAVWLVIALLVIVLLMFVLVDWYLKRGNQKQSDKPAVKKEATEPTDAKEKPTAEPVSTTVTPLPAMNIYNSNLADDLDAMIKADKAQPTRQERGNQITTRGHIAEYVAAKNYHTFSFDAEPNEDVNPSMTFTKEDYKKIVALSNIDDKK